MEWRSEGGRYCEGRTEYAQALSSLSFADDFSHVWFGGGGGLVVQEAGGSCVRCWKSSGASVLRKEAYLIDDLNVVHTDGSISSLKSHDGQY